MTSRSPSGHRRATATNPGWIEFSIHGRATMRVERSAPTAPQLRDMFAPFVTEGLGRHDITVTTDLEPMAEASHAEHEYRYTDRALHLLRPQVQFVVDDDEYGLHGSRELLTSLLPLVDHVLVQRRVAMIHAATFAYQGHGIAMPAWGGVGKTSTIAKLAAREGVEFMGDDWAFLTEEATLLGYAKPMFIKPHHRPIYPHLFDQKKKPLVPSALSRPIAELTTLVHPFVTRYPRLAGASRRWSPEHMMVTPQQALPHARIATSAPLAFSTFVERFDGTEPDLAEQDPTWMASRVLGNFHAELTRYSREVITALGATGLLPIENLFAEKATVLEKALNDKPAFLLRVPASYPADRASDVIVEHLFDLARRCGIAED